MNKEFEAEVGVLVQTKIKNYGKQPATVFYGSSSFRLWETLSEDIPEINVLNIAFGGSTIEDCIAYYNLLLKQTTPERMFFYAGDNDIGNGATVNEVVKRFQLLLDLIKNDFPRIPFYFLSIKPSPERAALIDIITGVNSELKKMIEQEDHCHYVDVHTSMMNGTSIRGELFCDDELHMNEKGYLLWKNKVRESLGLGQADEIHV